jgi:hypothetical protein
MSVFRHGLTFVPLRLGAQVGHAGRDVRTSRAERSYGRRYTVAYAMGR